MDMGLQRGRNRIPHPKVRAFHGAPLWNTTSAQTLAVSRMRMRPVFYMLQYMIWNHHDPAVTVSFSALIMDWFPDIGNQVILIYSSLGWFLVALIVEPLLNTYTFPSPDFHSPIYNRSFSYSSSSVTSHLGSSSLVILLSLPL